MHADRDEKPRLELRLLGPFRACVDGNEVGPERWRRRKPLLLVKLLGLQKHHRMHREQVMDALWPDLDTEAAANQLYKALHLARRALEPDLAPRADSRYLVARDQTIALAAPGGVWIDVDEFDERAADALRSGDAAKGEAALALYADDLLGDDLYEEWTAARRESLRLAWLRLLHLVAEACERDGRYDRAAELFERAVAADPSDETAHCGAMRAHARAGRRHLARRQFAECEAALRREVDAAPSNETVALRDAIEAGKLDPPPAVEPKPAAPTHAVTPAPAPVARPVGPRRRAAAAVCCGLILASMLVPLAFVSGKWQHKLALFVEKAERLMAADRGAPRLLSLRGRLDYPGARLEALDSISGWATLADADGHFTLCDVQWNAGADYDLVLSTGLAAPRVLRVTAPEAYPSDGVLEIGDLIYERARVVDATNLYGRNSISYIDFDVANAAYYRGVFDALTLNHATDEERIDALNRFVASRYAPEDSPLTTATPRGTLEIGTPNSGALSVAMATVCYAGGYGVRLVDMAETLGGRRSHMIVEVYFGGEWHAYDPSYGIAVRDQTGRVLSYEEIRTDPSSIATAGYASIPRPGWDTELIPALYVSGIHHLYVFRRFSTNPTNPTNSWDSWH